MTVRRRVLSVLATTSLVATALVALTAAPAAAAAYDNTDPEATGCARTARTIDRRDIGGGYALLELRYSSGCRTTWARVTLTSGLRCVPGDDHCATAFIRRNSDGYARVCGTPGGVRTSCYTRQVNDAGVTSFAEASYDNGPNSYYARTISY
jgi:hypothetical protein